MAGSRRSEEPARAFSTFRALVQFRIAPLPVTVNSRAAAAPAGSPSRTIFVSTVPLRRMAVLRHMGGTPWLTAALMYGAGLRLLECKGS